MELNVLRANPAGNITLFVLDPVPLEDRAGIAARLIDGSDAEQVGKVSPPHQAGQSRKEIAGRQYSRNATRAFGMLVSQEHGSPAQIMVEVSGCDGPVPVEVDWSVRSSRAQMPLPRSVRPIQVDGHPGTLVELAGIAHLVVERIPPSQDFFQLAEPLFQDIPDLEAYGVIFLDSDQNTITPLVKVPAVDSLVWEGSCGSGTLAAAVAQSDSVPDGPFVRSYVQPAGVVEASVVRQNGKVVSASIGGLVSLDAPVTVQL